MLFPCSETERYKRIKWQDLRVGDIVHLSNNETVPADILLLRTSDPHGVCYIDTCDLDGETNLKRREVSKTYTHICMYNCERPLSAGRLSLKSQWST